MDFLENDVIIEILLRIQIPAAHFRRLLSKPIPNPPLLLVPSVTKSHDGSHCLITAAR
jgi:hypothetical protein